MAGGGFDLAGLVGGVFSGLMNRQSQIDTNNANSQMNYTNLAHNERLANTAHQREVQDLQKAGLNPVLSAGGSGAASPTTGMNPMVAPTIELPDLMAYGISLKQLEQKDQEISNQTAATTAGIANQTADTDLKKVQKILGQKGMLRAEAEGEASGLLKQIMKSLKDSVRKPKLPTTLQEFNQNVDKSLWMKP